MTFINYASREINCKIIIAGPTGGDKVELARSIYDSIPASHRTETSFRGKARDEIVSFDFVPPQASVRGFKVRFHLYSLPDTLSWALRQLFLRGVDGIVIVSDALVSEAMVASIQSLKDGLEARNTVSRRCRSWPSPARRTISKHFQSIG